MDTLDHRYRYDIVAADGTLVDTGLDAASAEMYLDILRDHGHVVSARVTRLASAA